MQDNDVHFNIVRLPAQDSFDSGDTTIIYHSSFESLIGPGRLLVTSAMIEAFVTYQMELPRPGETRTLGLSDLLGPGSQGELISEARYGTIVPSGGDSPQWIARNALVAHKTLGTPDVLSIRTRLAAAELEIKFVEGLSTKYTREVFVGASLPDATGIFTFNEDGSARADRIEGTLFGRRASVRTLHDPVQALGQQGLERLAVVYDGEPLIGAFSEALWLTLSLISGNSIEPAYVETFSASGTLLERRYRFGKPFSTRHRSPFHGVYCALPIQGLEDIVSAFYRLLTDGFPIDVVMSHLYEAVGATIDSMMQSLLLAVHTAIEAWNRLNEVPNLIPQATWEANRDAIVDAAANVATPLSVELAAVIAAKIKGSNHTSTASRQRRLLHGIGMTPKPPEKEALRLRNALFHDGYLRRQLQYLNRGELQERYDQLETLRDVAFRIVFGLLKYPHSWQSFARPYLPTNCTRESNG
ncbi:MAG TPA: hypothetical protein VGU66_12335 [Candidatus Elarobacter sp.]|nr:hypothetical protein [Candidatus Elarobacter sp.]